MHRSSIQVKTVQNKYSISHKWVHSSHLVYLFKGQYCRNETWIYFRVVNVQLVIYHPLKITQHTAIIVKKDGNKTEYMLSDNSCSAFNHAKPHVLFIIVCLTRPYKCVHLVLEQFKFGSLSTILSYWPLDVQHAPHGKDLSEDLIIRVVALHKDGLGYKKFSNSLELQYSGQGHTEIFQDGFHSEQASQGSIKEVVLVLWVRCRSWLQKTDTWVLPALL